MDKRPLALPSPTSLQCIAECLSAFASSHWKMSNLIVGKKLLGRRLLGVWFFLARSTAIHKKSGGGKLRKAHETASCKSALKTPIRDPGIPEPLYPLPNSAYQHPGVRYFFSPRQEKDMHRKRTTRSLYLLLKEKNITLFLSARTHKYVLLHLGFPRSASHG